MDTKNNKNKKYFINTTDEEVAERLRKYGFPELPKNGNKWVFVNELPENNVIFSDHDISEISFTNNLVI